MKLSIDSENERKVTGRLGEPRRQCYQLTKELELVIEFHYHYIRYFLNGEEALFPAFDAESLFAYASGEGGEAIFLLLLPITHIQPEQAQRVFDRLMQFLPGLVQFPVSVLFIANRSVRGLTPDTTRKA